MRFALILVALLCSCDGPTAAPTPTPSPTTPTITIAPTEPPRVDIPFDLVGAVGFTLFAGARATDDEIRREFSRFQSRLGPRAYARVCAELQSWPTASVMVRYAALPLHWLPRGVSASPFDESAPAYIQLERFLEATARIPGAQVLLMPICTIKEDGTSPANREKWVRTVARLASEYEHVALEVVNEWRHPNSSISEAEAASLIVAARREFDGLIGMDDSIRPASLRYNGALRRLVDFVSFHPCRGESCGWRGGPDPSPRELRDIFEENGFYLLSEIVAFDGFGADLGPCCTDDRNRILDYIGRCARVEGCDVVYHCVGCLGWPETEIVWIPGL